MGRQAEGIFSECQYALELLILQPHFFIIPLAAAGGIFIVLDYCISVTERELINVTSFRCVSEILRLDNVFAILEL